MALNKEAAERPPQIRIDERTLQQVDGLADRNFEGLLTTDESSQYEAMMATSDVLTVLQAKA